MADFAELGLRFVPVNDAAATKALSDVATGSDRAEIASKKLTATQESAARTQRAVAEANRVNTSALGQMAQAIAAADAAQRAAVASTQKLGAAVQASAAQAKAASVSFNTFYDAAERDFATQYVGSMNKVVGVHGKAVGSSKAMTQATLNLSRQFADVGVTAAMGMSPLMILIQQGPQIADAFSMAKTQGIGFSDIMRNMKGVIGPLIPIIAGVGAVLGVVVGGFALFEREIDKNTKYATTWGDTWKATVHVVGDAIMNGPIGTGLRWLTQAWNGALDTIVHITFETFTRIPAFISASYKTIVANWGNLPGAFEAIFVAAANAGVKAVAWMVNGNIRLLNKLLDAWSALGPVKIHAPEVDFSGFMLKASQGATKAEADLNKFYKQDLASYQAAGRGFVKDVADQADKEYLARQKAVEGLKDHTKALKDQKEALDRTAPLTADLSKMVNLDAPASTKGFERTLKEINGELKTLPDITAKAVDVMEAFYAAANDAGSGVDQLFQGLHNRDWTSAVSGLLRAAKAIKEAFGKGGTTEGKIGAIAGIADGIGQAVGGTAGSVLSGAAGGAMGGVSLALALGGPVGWIAAAGAAIGGLFGLFGSNSKKQAEKEAARQAAAEKEAQRQADIANQRREIELNIVALSGDAVATLAAQREAELAGIDESNKALARQMYALQDAKKITDERTALEVRYMQATGDEAGILAKARAEEVKGIDATNRALLDLVYAQEDYAGRLAGAKTDLAAAYEREAAAIQTTQDKFAGLAKTLREFGDSLDPANQAGGGSYGAARFKFLKTASGTDAESLAGIPDAGRAFIAASAANSRTLLAFQRDIATVRNATRAGENSALNQASIAEQQLAGIKAQVSGLITLNDSVLSLPAAIAALLAVQATAPTATPASVAPTGPSATSPNWTSYLNRYADVMAWAQSGHGDPTKPIDGQTLEDRAKYHYYNSGMTEGRTPFATGGSFTVGGMGGVDSQNFGPIALSPGEVVNVRRPGAANDEDMAGALSALAAEVAALRQDVRAGNANTKKTADILTRVTPNGDTLLTEAA